jgi:hypothetical protein
MTQQEWNDGHELEAMLDFLEGSHRTSPRRWLWPLLLDERSRNASREVTR